MEDDTKHVTNYVTNVFKGTISSKVIHKITEWFWKFDLDYELFFFRGNEPETKLSVQHRKAHYEVVTTTEDAPRKDVVVRDAIDLNLTWLLKHLRNDEEFSVEFKIARGDAKCWTPRRNPQVDAALGFFQEYHAFCTKLSKYFRQDIFPLQRHDFDLSTINANKLFVPILPLFENPATRGGAVAGAVGSLDPGAGADTPKKGTGLAKMFSKGVGNVKGLIQLGGGAGAKSPRDALRDSMAQVGLPSKHQEDETSPILFLSDVSAMLDEQRRSISEKCVELQKVFHVHDKLITPTEAFLLLAADHAMAIAQAWKDGVDYVEHMIRTQLIAAIGKVVKPLDFSHYMRFHNRKLFRDEFVPRPFCYAIRRPDHYPEGLISIEVEPEDGSMAEEIHTVVSRRPAGTQPMHFLINAATEVSFFGDAYLHAWVGHKFSDSGAPRASLNARARQFSSFLLMVGRISGPGQFDPKYGIILQNKDDLKIPLDFETIPTPKEFKEAISSISPEQQRFAKAFRAMQLESTLFGICVVQIKPQLEKLLRIANDGLTKEIRLTQDLLELFIKYQIPSDLLSYDGPEDASSAQKVSVVKGYVAAMYEMINDKKKTETEERAQEAIYAVADNIAEGGYGGYAEECDDGDMDLDLMAAPTLSLNRLAMDMGEEMQMSSFSAPPPRMALSKASSAAPPPKPSAVGSIAKPVAAAAPKAAAPSTPSTKDTTTTTGAQQLVIELKPKAPEKVDGKEIAPEPATADAAVVDYTQIPKELDAKFEKYDDEGTLRPTIINVSNEWRKRAQKALLLPLTESSLDTDAQGLEKDKCYDLLDALSKSGCLPFGDAQLHVVMASTHCFDKSLMDTLVQANVNPIEKVERSTLIVATTIFGLPASELVRPEQLERVSTYSPKLFASLPASGDGGGSIENNNNAK